MPRGYWIAIALALGPMSGGTEAQSIRGQLGQQSRATIRISVSVAPRFSISKDRRTGANEALKVSSNAGPLRYALVREPASEDAPQAIEVPSGAGTAPDSGGRGSALVLVVPD
jgi:hypothetical protein